MKLKIVNSGTKEFPFYQIMDGENELCATDNLVNAEKIVKLCTLPHVRLSLPISVNKGSELYAKKLREHYDKEIPDELKYIDGFQDAIRAINELHEGNEA